MNRHSIRMYWRMRCEKMWLWIAQRLPGRLLYFAVLQALGRVSMSDKYRHIDVGTIPAMTVIKELEKAYE